MKISFLFQPMLALLWIVFSGCKASPVEPAGFAAYPDMMKQYDLIPGDKIWKDPNVKLSDYDKIIVMPVFTEKQLDRTWMERQNIRTWLNNEDQDVKDFAKYTEEAFKKALQESKKFKLATEPGPNTMILELALVKIVPGKPILGVLGNISNLSPIGFLLMPIKVSINASTDSPMQASVAIEGNIRDSQSKKVIACFADNEKQSVAIFNFNDFTAYGNLRDIINEWTRQFIEVLEKRPLVTGEKIERRSPVKTIGY